MKLMAKELNKQELEQREGMRKVAFDNLRNPQITSLAAIYLIDKTGQYGDAVNSAMEQYKYIPSIQGSDGSSLIGNALLRSREDGMRYSGSVTERSLIKNCAQILQESLLSLKISDIPLLLGLNGEIATNHNIYLSDLASSEKEEDQKLLQNLIGSYQAYLIDKKASEALEARSKAVGKNLESLLK